MKEGWMKNDEGWMKNDKRMNEEWWRMMISSWWGVLHTDRQTDRRMDICDCGVAFATEKWVASVTLAFSLLIG